MKQKKLKEEGEHEVNVTITIAKASLTDNENAVGGKNNLPQVQNYFHCEYKLLPDDKDFTKIDVVTFGMAAKMYGDNDSKVLRTWLEGNMTWVAWTSSRKLRVTQEMLLKMFSHQFELKVWDTKDKVSAKARFDRPKAFRLPLTKAADELDLDNIRQLLLNERKINVYLGLGLISQSTLITADNSLAKNVNKKVSFLDKIGTAGVQKDESSSSGHLAVSTSDSKMEVQVKLDENKQPQFKNLFLLASTGDKPLSIDTEETKEIRQSDGERNASRQQSIRSDHRSRKTSSKSRNKTNSTADSERVHQNGITSVSIPLSALFTNRLSVSNNMAEPVSSLKEVLVILTLDRPLLSQRQRHILNPMTLTVGSATQMPDNFLSFSKLKNRCKPPYVKYKFHDYPEHVSEKKEHASTIKFNDQNVMLLGIVKKELLFEYIRGPTFKIEVHDRDPLDSTKKLPSSVFGSKEQDNEIWNVTNIDQISGEKSKNGCYFGIAEYEISSLLSGERIIHLTSPIRKSDQSTHVTGSNIPPGSYLEYGSDLNIKIELARSLLDEDTPLTASESRVLSPLVFTTEQQCPFSRMVYIFDYKNRKFLGEILSEVTTINAKTLNLSSFPQHVINAALSTFKLTDEQKNDKTLDIITGCQIIDGEYHIFILEGIAKEGIARIWNNLEHPEYKEDSFFRVLYNSSMSFASRLYENLEVDLTRIKLHEPLAVIVKQPLLYVRDMVPRLCFQAVSKLFQLCQCTSIHSAVRNEILPSAEMMVSMGKEFGVPLTSSDFHDGEKSLVKTPELYGTHEQGSRENLVEKYNGRVRKPLDTRNEMYEKMLEMRKYGQVPHKDHVCANIKSLLALSKAKTQQPSVICDEIEVAHNYSTQTLNSTAMALETLREALAKEKDNRYTYCPKYNSATIIPVSAEKLMEENEIKAANKKKWRMKGFVFPGVKSSMESNQHSKQVHPARIQELRIPWRENVLHRNMTKPTVDRMLFRWDDRHLDFHSLSTSKPYFDDLSPVTIHAAGDTLDNEQLMIKQTEELNWKKKLVVDDISFKTHRCLAATELTAKGLRASNQHDRLTDILKDEPKKYSLSKPGLRHDRTSALSVVSYPNIDAFRHPTDDSKDETYQDEYHVGFTPGQLEGVSWSRDKNIIPLKDYQHSYFEKLKGKEFRLVHTDRENVLMKIKPLTTEEKDNNLFF